MSDEECQAMEELYEDTTSTYSTKHMPVKDTRLGILIERTANLITVEIELPEGICYVIQSTYFYIVIVYCKTKS